MARGLRNKAKVIDEVVPAEVKVEVEPVQEKVFVGSVTTRLNVRASASLNSAILKTVEAGTQIKYTIEENGFYKLADEDGWVMKQYIM